MARENSSNLSERKNKKQSQDLIQRQFNQFNFTACLFFTEPSEKKLLNIRMQETESEEKQRKQDSDKVCHMYCGIFIFLYVRILEAVSLFWAKCVRVELLIAHF